MALTLELDRESSSPLYQQIVEQVKTQISDGRLPTGSRLPTVRQLAERLGVTRLTVHSAYSELQADGWVEATVGRGTFVKESAQTRHMLATVGRQITPDGVMEDMPRITQMPSLRSLAYADPDPALTHAEEFWASLIGLAGDKSALFQYNSSQGDAALRVEVAELLRERHLECVPEQIIITSGVSQGLALLTQALAQPGDAVAVEAPTYLGLLHILKSQGLRPIPIPLDEEGPRLDVLECVAVQERPRFFYTIPTFQNPTGICMSPRRRQEVVTLAERFGLMVVEDDLYARLAYDQPAPPPLKSLDRQGRVIYLDSLSKVLLPGLRIGFVVAPSPLHERLLSLRRAADLCGSPFVQRATADFLRTGKLRNHLRRVVPIYRERRDTLLRGMKRWMPEGVRWTRPEGGYCCWVTLPATPALNDLYHAALERGVAFTPGQVFLSEATPEHHMRLCFGSQPPEVIHESLSVLGNLIRERLDLGVARRRQAVEWVPLV